MEQVADVINSLIGINQQVIGVIIPLCLVYLVLFWLLVSIWVFFDAKKRYENDFIAVTFAVLNFIPPFNFLILVFYLVIRPDIRFDDFDEWEAGGVNVPIVNFMGKEGIEMSLELRINPKRLKEADKTNDMTVEIGWDKRDEKFKLIDRDELARQVLGEDYEESDNSDDANVRNVFSDAAGRVKKSVTLLKSRIQNISKRKPKVEEEEAEESDEKEVETKEEEKKEEEKKEVKQEGKKDNSKKDSSETK